jgi:hypothetical protein
MSKGIYMLALGHPNYGKMAAALAATMKFADKQIKIAVFYNDNALGKLSNAELNLFDEKIELGAHYYTNVDGSFNPIKARLYAYDQTPFDETLCIDVDNLWISKITPTEVMEGLSANSFTIANNGHTIADEKANKKFSPWAKIADVIKAYDIKGKRFYDTSGEWFYFKKDETAKSFFEVAQNIFNTPPTIKVSKFIGQAIPDELAFAIAIAQTELYPHENYYRPTSWNVKQTYMALCDLRKLCYSLCMGGSSNNQHLIKNYNRWCAHVYKNLDLQNPFTWKQKKHFIPERAKI